MAALVALPLDSFMNMNKYSILFLISILLSGSIASSQLLDLGDCKPNGISNKAIQKLKKTFKEARIIILSEQVHGVGTDYVSFALMTKFLHEEMGFNVILQEFCFDYFGRINSNLAHSSAQAYSKGMYWPQAKAVENDLLFNYIDAQNESDNPIYMEGFDPRLFQRETVYRHYDSILRNPKFNLINTRVVDEYLTSLDNILKKEYNDSSTTASQKRIFYEQTDLIIERMVQHNYDQRSIQKMKNLKSFAENAWNPRNYSINNPDRFFVRERQMAENIIWFAETMYPDEKIIVRMHNGHAAKDILKFDQSPEREYLNAGTILHQQYGSECLHIGSTYYSGTYCDWDYEPKDIPIPHSRSLEAKLHNQGYDYAFVNLKQKSRKFFMFYSEFNSWKNSNEIKGNFGVLYDGIIFINQVTLPTEK